MAQEREVDVCVVGAGYAGLAAARSLARGGLTVAVLEARDRVGGRVWTQTAPDGTPVDIGGTWIGAGQTEIYKLAAELGIETYPTFATGDVALQQNGKVRRYSGRIPRTNPLTVFGIAVALSRLERMAKQVPKEEPWTARHATRWDRRTVGEWVNSHVP